MSPSSLRGVRNPFRSLVAGFVPEAARLDDAGWQRAELLVEDLLARRPRRVRRQVRLFVRVLDVLSVARWGRRLARLDGARRLRWLGSLQDSRWLLIRRGIWGLRTLAFLAYYGRPAGRESVGYRASPDGWTSRRGAAEADG